MTVLYWILGSITCVVLLVWIYLVWLGWRLANEDVRSRFRDLDEQEVAALLERVPRGAAFARERGWEFESGTEFADPQNMLAEITWTIEDNRRYFSAMCRRGVDEKCSFGTFMRSRATRESVIIISTYNGEGVDGDPESGVLVEAFQGDDLLVLQLRHEQAVRYMRYAGDCEVAQPPRPAKAWVVEHLELQRLRVRSNPRLLLLMPFALLFTSIFHYHRPIARRYPKRSKTMRRLRGEIMHSPRSHL